MGGCRDSIDIDAITRRRSTGVHRRDETAKQMLAVRRAGAGFGMILDAEGVFFGAGEAFVAAVEEADMGDVDSFGEGGVFDGEAVVLAGYFYFPGSEFLYRLVGAAVAPGELVGLGTEG